MANWPEDDDMTAPAASQFTNPIVLFGNVVAQPNADAPIPSANMLNPSGSPMELLEVRFRLVPRPPNSLAASGITGMGVGVKMDIGNVGVVNAYVPVSALGTVRDSYEYQPQVFTDPTQSATKFAYPTTYGWRLKYPLFIPANKVVTTVVRPLGQNAYPVSVDVAYICRTWDVRRPMPQTTKVPWVSSYRSPVFDYVTGQGSYNDFSSSLDIYNPWNTPLELSRLGGRLSILQNAANTSLDVVVEEPMNYRARLASFTMRSSRGFDVVRTPTAFSGLFPYGWRAWDIADKWEMAPGEFYTTRVQVAPVTETIDTSFAAQLQFAIDVLGYRDVPVSAL